MSAIQRLASLHISRRDHFVSLLGEFPLRRYTGIFNGRCVSMLVDSGRLYK
jgi:hypothetical protein